MRKGEFFMNSKINKNIFVIGDLVIDHTIFLKSRSSEKHNPIGGEKIFKVLRRQDTAGGAANCARILAVINEGQTSLWGVLGQSCWGDFRSILQNCHTMDEADSNIEFRAVEDESNTTMNIITRLIKLDSDKTDYRNRYHELRYDDYGHLHVPDTKRETVLYYLKRSKEKFSQMDAIIINDLDMGTLTKELVQKIADFAYEHEIPLFIDPKRKKDKYEGINATAILPNLKEWCSLVDEENNFDDWRKKIKRESGLIELAIRSFAYLPTFKYHIIKCDIDGAIIIGPHPQKQNHHSVYHIPPHSGHDGSGQIGCGDIMLGVLAAFFDKSKSEMNYVIETFLKANAVVSCYLKMPWHRMPNLEVVSEEIEKLERERKKIEPTVIVSDGILYLPKKETIVLADSNTNIPDIVSVDRFLRDKLDEFVQDIKFERQGKDTKSIILTSSPGSGKTAIINAIPEMTKNSKISTKILKMYGIDFTEIESLLLKEIEALEKKGGQHWLIIDEALKGEGFKKYFMECNIIPSMDKPNIRFIFIDAKFIEKIPDLSDEITRRCTIYQLPPLDKHAQDIPYIVGHILAKLEKGKGSKRVIKIESNALLAIMNSALASGTVSKLHDYIKETFNNACSTTKNGELKIKFQHLPKNLKDSENSEAPAFIPKEFRFFH